MIKACLFDLDGTLLDTLESIRYYLNRVLEKYGYQPVTTAEAKIFVGNGAKNLVRRALQKGNFDFFSERGKLLFDKIHKEYVEDYDASPFYLTAPYPGISELLKALYSRGIKLAVISNKPDMTVKQLIEMNFENLFEVVYGAREGVPLKPDPAAPIEICKLLGVSPSEVAYVGDTGTDMLTGRAFAARLNIGVSWGFRDAEELFENGADDVVSTATEIVALIDNIKA